MPSSQGPPPLVQDYLAESKVKYPLPDYPREDDYEDAVHYEAACDQYKVEKLWVLNDWEEWREWEQVSDMACTAAAAHAQAGGGKLRQGAEETGTNLSTTP